MGLKLITDIRNYGTIFLLAGGLLFSAFYFAWESSAGRLSGLWLLAVLSVSLPGFVPHEFVSKLWSKVSPIDYPTLWETEVVVLLPVLVLTPVIAYVGGLYAAHESVSFMIAFLILMVITFLFGYVMRRYAHYLAGSPDLTALDKEFYAQQVSEKTAKPEPKLINWRKIIAAVIAPVAYMLCLILIVAGVVLVRSLIAVSEDLSGGNILGSLMNISSNMYGVAQGLLGCGLGFMLIALICDLLVSWGRKFRLRFFSALKGSIAIDYGLGLALFQSFFCALSVFSIFNSQMALWAFVVAYCLLIFSGFVAGAVYAAILGDDHNDSAHSPPAARSPSDKSLSDKREFIPQRWQAGS